MALQMQKAEYSDMEQLIALVFAAYEDPYEPFVDLLFPGIHQDYISREQGLHDAAERLLAGWKSRPYEHWLKVVDSKTGEIVALSRWSIFDTNPFAKGPPHVEATWYPEGSRKREYCTFLINSRLERQACRCSMPHVWLNMCCTHPKYRRNGAASMMVQWGVDKADELNCDSFIEASWQGRQVYEKFGFMYTDEYRTRRTDPEPDEAWKELEEKHPFMARWMWRPKQGKHDGKEVWPWEHHASSQSARAA